MLFNCSPQAHHVVLEGYQSIASGWHIGLSICSSWLKPYHHVFSSKKKLRSVFHFVSVHSGVELVTGDRNTPSQEPITRTEQLSYLIEEPLDFMNTTGLAYTLHYYNE